MDEEGAEHWTGEAPRVGRGLGAADWTGFGKKVACLVDFWISVFGVLVFGLVVEVLRIFL